MLLFEWPILRARRAQHIGNCPAVALREDAGHRPTRCFLFPAEYQRALEFDRNFCQDGSFGCVL